jgi:HD superfamily phosphohydrolase
VFTYFAREGEELFLDFLKDGMDRPDALSEVIQLLRTRYFLTERLYFHHTKVAAGAMVAKAVELALEEGLSEEELLSLDDCGLLGRLSSFSPRVGRLVERLRRRALLKRGYVLPASEVPEAERLGLIARFRQDRGERRRAEEELARELGVPPEEVIIYCPPLTWMKEAAVKVRTSRGILPLNHPQVAPEELRLLEHNYRQLWRFYVFVPEEARSRCAGAAEHLVGYPGFYFTTSTGQEA